MFTSLGKISYMVSKRSVFALTISLLLIILLIQKSSANILIYSHPEKSNIEYILSCLRIPIKIKKLPLSAQVEVNLSSNKSELILKSIKLSTRFTSKNILFRKTINYYKYPELSFISTLESPINLSGNHSFEITGDLSFHGVTRKIKMKLKNLSDSNCIHLVGNLRVKMKDFGIRPPFLLIAPIDNVIKTKVVLYGNLTALRKPISSS